MRRQRLSTRLGDLLAIAESSRPRASARVRRGRLVAIRDVFRRSDTDTLLRLLDRRLYPHLRRMWVPIPADTITGMRRNYAEQLPKTTRVLTAGLSPSPSPAYRVAREIGLLEMLRGESLRRLAERLSGERLAPGPSCQVICYGPGDYSGPHNDHHPENPNVRDGYVDAHVMLCDDGVADQRLVYEEDGYFTGSVDLSCRSGLAVYRLPFWHFTTPLVAKPGRRRARRWLLLASYDLARPGDAR